MAKIYIVFYSMYGHIYTLAKEVAAGVKEAGHEVELYQACLLRSSNQRQLHCTRGTC